MTPGQTALADGFAETLTVHGQSWTRTTDAKVIRGVVSKPVAENPSMVQAQDREEHILVADAGMVPVLTVAQVMPSPALKKGEELTKGSRKFRVVRSDLNDESLTWLVVLSPSF